MGYGIVNNNYGSKKYNTYIDGTASTLDLTRAQSWTITLPTLSNALLFVGIYDRTGSANQLDLTLVSNGSATITQISGSELTGPTYAGWINGTCSLYKVTSNNGDTITATAKYGSTTATFALIYKILG